MIARHYYTPCLFCGTICQGHETTIDEGVTYRGMPLPSRTPFFYRSPETATLRDQFAMAVITGLSANPKSWEALDYATAADVSYKQADAMLAARALGGKE